MPLHPTWPDIILRLVCAVLAGAIVGFNREERSQAAGLRTTVLICTAAALAMALGNFLLATGGKAPDGFAQFDVLRLPLGILSGMGFIGAGAILKKDEVVQGVTTAATLWFMSVVGIVIGAGAVWLGLGAAAGAAGLLWALTLVEGRIRRKISAELTVRARSDGLAESELRDRLAAHGYRVNTFSIVYDAGGAEYEATADVGWTGHLAERSKTPPVVAELLAAGAMTAHWRPTAI